MYLYVDTYSMVGVIEKNRERWKREGGKGGRVGERSQGGRWLEEKVQQGREKKNN